MHCLTTKPLSHILSQKSDPRQDVVSKSAVALDLSSSYMNPQLSDRPMVPEHTGNK